jgi:hypothetical protein
MDSSLRCPLEGCKAYYDLKDRLPISLLCCDNTACLKCVKDMIVGEIKEEIEKEKFKCAFNQCDHIAPRGMIVPMRPCVNSYAKK